VSKSVFPTLVPAVTLASALMAGPALAGEPVNFPGAKVVTFKDPECFDRLAEVPSASLAGATKEAATAACVTIKAGGKTYYVLPSALKPIAGCGPARKTASGPQATTYGSQGASSCPRG
jgi:hypothetical protein